MEILSAEDLISGFEKENSTNIKNFFGLEEQNTDYLFIEKANEIFNAAGSSWIPSDNQFQNEAIIGDNQSTGELVGNTLLGGGLNLITGLAQSLDYDLPDIKGLILEEEKQYGNWFNDLYSQLSEFSQEQFPIYTRNDSLSNSKTWYKLAQQVPQIFGQVAGVIGTNVAIASATGGSGLIASIPTSIKTAVTAGRMSMQNAYLNSVDTFKETYQIYKNKENYSDQDALKLASISASENYKREIIATIGINALQLNLLKKVNSNLSPNSNITGSNQFARNLKDIGISAGAEGIEESLEELNQRYSIHSSLKNSHELSKLDFYDSEIRDSFILGAVGGGFFNILGKTAEKNYNSKIKKENLKNEFIKDSILNKKKISDDLDTAIQNNDQELFDKIKYKINQDFPLEAINLDIISDDNKTNNIDDYIFSLSESLEGVKNNDENILKKYNINNDLEKNNILNNYENNIKQALDIKELYLKNKNIIDQNLLFKIISSENKKNSSQRSIQNNNKLIESVLENNFQFKSLHKDNQNFIKLLLEEKRLKEENDNDSLINISDAIQNHKENSEYYKKEKDFIDSIDLKEIKELIDENVKLNNLARENAKNLKELYKLKNDKEFQDKKIKEKIKDENTDLEKSKELFQKLDKENKEEINNFLQEKEVNSEIEKEIVSEINENDLEENFFKEQEILNNSIITEEDQYIETDSDIQEVQQEEQIEIINDNGPIEREFYDEDFYENNILFNKQNEFEETKLNNSNNINNKQEQEVESSNNINNQKQQQENNDKLKILGYKNDSSEITLSYPKNEIKRIISYNEEKGNYYLSDNDKGFQLDNTQGFINRNLIFSSEILNQGDIVTSFIPNPAILNSINTSYYENEITEDFLENLKNDLKNKKITEKQFKQKIEPIKINFKKWSEENTGFSNYQDFQNALLEFTSDSDIELKRKIDTWVEQVPILVKDKNNNNLGYIHTPDWYNVINIADKEDSPGLQEKIIEQGKLNVIALRNEIIFNNGEFKNIVTNKSDGFLEYYPEKKNVSIIDNNPTTQLSIVTLDINSNLIFNLDNGEKLIYNEEESFIGNKKIELIKPFFNIKVGDVLELRKGSSKNKYFLLYTQKSLINEEDKITVKNLIDLYLSKNNDNIQRKIISESKKDVYSSGDIVNLLKSFINIGFLSKDNIDLTSKVNAQNVNLQNGTPFLHFSNNNIVFGIKGKNIRNTKKKYIILIPGKDNKDNLNILKEDILPLFNNNISLNYLIENKKRIILKEENQKLIFSLSDKNYVDSSKEKTLTNVKSFNISTSNDPEYISYVNSNIRIQPINNNNNNNVVKEEKNVIKSDSKNEIIKLQNKIKLLKEFESDENQIIELENKLNSLIKNDSNLNDPLKC